MKERDPFGQALMALRYVLARGVAPQQHLAIIDIAADLRLSTSPVREALSRLCGEGLIEDRRGLGYFTRALPAEDIVALLELERVHVELALRLTSGAVLLERAAPPAERLRALVDASLNEPLKESFERVSQRLEPLRRLWPEPSCDASGSSSDWIAAYYAAMAARAADLSVRHRRLEAAVPEYRPNTV